MFLFVSVVASPSATRAVFMERVSSPMCVSASLAGWGTTAQWSVSATNTATVSVWRRGTSAYGVKITPW